MGSFRDYRHTSRARSLFAMVMKCDLGDPFISMGLAVAFVEGFDACRSGAPRRCNPYVQNENGRDESGREAAEAWADGWEHCGAELGVDVTARPP